MSLILKKSIINRFILYLLCLVISVEFFSYFYIPYKNLVNALIIFLSFFITCVLLLTNKLTIKPYFLYFSCYLIFSLSVSIFIHLYQLETLFWGALLLKLLIFSLMIIIFQNCFDPKYVKRSINIFFSLFLFSIVLGLIVSNFIFLNDRLRFNGSAVTGSFVGMLSGIFLCYFASGYLDFKFRSILISSFFCVILVVILYYVGSRQPFIGFFVSLIFAFLSMRRYSFILVLLTVFFVFLYKFNFIYNFIVNYEDFFISQSLNDNSLLYRFRYFEFAFEYMDSIIFILFGMGLNSFPLLFPEGVAGSLHATHNLVLFFFVNFGLLGVIVFTCVYVHSLYISKFSNKLLLYYLLFGCSLNNPEYFISVLLLFIMVFFYNKGSS